MTKIYAVHFLESEGTHRLGSNHGRDSKPWKIGETRTATGKLEMCANGYHFSPTWWQAYRGGFIYGPIACIVEVDQKPSNMDGHKGISRSRKLIEMHIMKPSDYKRWRTRSLNNPWGQTGAESFAKFMGELTGWYDVP